MYKKLENNNGFSAFNTSTLNVIRRRYSPQEVPWRGIHNAIAIAMSICVAVGNKVMDTPELPQPIKRHEAPKYDICSVGRSIIEMLGVLAIIAVLSVGGIAGYSKALREWRSNQQKNMITELIASAIKIKLNLNSKSESFDNITYILNAMGELPEGTIYKNNAIYDNNGNYTDLTYGLMTNSYTHNKYFMYVIRFYFRGNVNSLSPSAKDFCYNVVMAARSVTNEVLRIELVQSNSQSESKGNSKTIFSNKNLQNATPADIYQKCNISLIDSNSMARFVIQLNPK